MSNLQKQWFDLLAGSSTGKYRLYGKTWNVGNDIQHLTSPFKFFARYRGLLPREYQEVEYLESTGEQYIDLSGKFTEPIDLEIKIQYYDYDKVSQDTSGHNGNNALQMSFGFGYTSVGRPYTNPTHVFYYASGRVHTTLQENNAYILSFEKSTRTVKVNGNHVGDFPVPEDPIDFSHFYLFANYYYETRSAAGFTKQRIYYAKFGNVLNLIPCYRKADKKAGLYDTVNNVFYTNQGTGADFNVGKEVNLVKTYTPESIFYIDGVGTAKGTFDTHNGELTKKINIMAGTLLANENQSILTKISNGYFSIEAKYPSSKPFADMKNITDMAIIPNINLAGFKSVPYWYMQYQPIEYSISVYNGKIYIYSPLITTIFLLQTALRLKYYVYELATPITEQQLKIMLPRGIDYILDANGVEVPFEELTNLNNFSNKKFEGKDAPTITAEKVITKGFTSSNGEHFTQLYIYEDGEIWYVNNQGSAQAFASNTWETEYKQIQFDSGVRLTTEERNALLNAYDLI